MYYGPRRCRHRKSPRRYHHGCPLQSTQATARRRVDWGQTNPTVSPISSHTSCIVVWHGGFFQDSGSAWSSQQPPPASVDSSTPSSCTRTPSYGKLSTGTIITSMILRVTSKFAEKLLAQSCLSPSWRYTWIYPMRSWIIQWSRNWRSYASIWSLSARIYIRTEESKSRLTHNWATHLTRSLCRRDHNLVTIVMHQLNLDPQTAMHCISNLHDNLASQFLDQWKKIPTFERPLDLEVRMYCDGLGNFVRANESWSFEVCLQISCPLSKPDADLRVSITLERKVLKSRRLDGSNWSLGASSLLSYSLIKYPTFAWYHFLYTTTRIIHFLLSTTYRPMVKGSLSINC